MEEAVEAAVRSALSQAPSAAPVGDSGPVSGPTGVVRETSDGPRYPPPPGSPDVDQMALFVSGPGPGEPSVDDADGAAVLPTGDDVLPVERPRLMQYHRQWIVAEAREGLLIIDQHSAHERVLFDRLMQAYEAGGAEAQRLLFPLTVRLTSQELREVDDVRGLLARAGFEVEVFGRDTAIVHTVPNPHPWFDAERCFREMVAELTEGTSDLMRSARNQHERIAMTFACKGAIKAGQALSYPEMRELFDALFATELPWHDVHGRPTIVRLSNAELERKFGR